MFAALTLSLCCARASQAHAQATTSALAQARGAASAHLEHARLAAASRALAAPSRRAEREQDERVFLQREAALEARLGLQLYALGEDWRAITALQRYQLIEGSAQSAHLSGLIIGKIYERNQRPKLAALSFEQAVAAAPDDASRVWSYFLETQQICAALDYWVECRWRLDQLFPLRDAMLPEQRDLMLYQSLFADVMLRREGLSPQSAQAIADEALRQKAQGLLAQDAAFDELALKRPVLAASLSAVLPGAGQLYNGRYRDAGIALGLNAGFGAATYYSFAELESIPLGVVSSLLLAGFYAGNVYNAYTDARQINAQRYATFFTGLKSAYWPKVAFSVERNRVKFGFAFDWAARTPSAPSEAAEPPRAPEESQGAGIEDPML